MKREMIKEITKFASDPLTTSTLTPQQATDLDNMLNALDDVPSASGNLDMNDEVDAYIKSSTNTSASEDCFLYWRRYMTMFPRVYQVALRVMSTVGTAVAPENLFSRAGILSERRRARLKVDTMDMMLFEHWNRRFGE